MEHEFRASEIAEMMPSQHAVQLAIKYASRLRMLQLAQRLNEVRINIILNDNRTEIVLCFLLSLVTNE